MSPSTPSEPGSDAPADPGSEPGSGPSGPWEPNTPARMPRALARAGALLCLLEGLVLLGFAVFYVVELARGEGSDPGTVVLSAVLIAITGALLLLLARLWQRGSRRAPTPTMVWNLLLVPAAITVYSSGQPALGLLMAVAVVASLLTSFAAASAARQT